MNAQADQALIEKLKSLPPERRAPSAAPAMRIVVDTNTVLSI